LNSFSNDITNIFDIALPDADFRGILPQNIDMEINV
jgi:hypothetical protein